MPRTYHYYVQAVIIVLQMCCAALVLSLCNEFNYNTCVIIIIHEVHVHIVS